MIGHKRPEPRPAVGHPDAQAPREKGGREVAVHHLPKAHLPLHAGHLDGIEGAEEQRKGIEPQWPDQGPAPVKGRDEGGEKLQQHKRRARDAEGDDENGEIVPLLRRAALDEGAVHSILNEQEGEVHEHLQQGDLTADLRRQQPCQDDADHKADELDGEALCEFVDKRSNDFAFFHRQALNCS